MTRDGLHPDDVIIGELPVGRLSAGYFETTIRIRADVDGPTHHSESTQYPRRFITGSTTSPWFVDDEWSEWARETNSRIAHDDELRRERYQAYRRADLAEDALCHWADEHESSAVIRSRLVRGGSTPEQPVRFSWLHGPGGES